MGGNRVTVNSQRLQKMVGLLLQWSVEIERAERGHVELHYAGSSVHSSITICDNARGGVVDTHKR